MAYKTLKKSLERVSYDLVSGALKKERTARKSLAVAEITTGAQGAQTDNTELETQLDALVDQVYAAADGEEPFLDPE